MSTDAFSAAVEKNRKSFNNQLKFSWH